MPIELTEERERLVLWGLSRYNTYKTLRGVCEPTNTSFFMERIDMLNVKENKKKLKVAIILDSSSSMDSIREEIVAAFDEQVRELKKSSAEVSVSLVEFGTKVKEPHMWEVDVADVGRLTGYKPDGMTALYDAMGKTISRMSLVPGVNDELCGVLVVVISDGQENNSKEYTARFLKQRIRELEKTERWTFTYIGANQDLLGVSESLGINIGNTVSFEADKRGVRRMSEVYCTAASNFIRGFDNGKMSSDNMFT